MNGVVVQCAVNIVRAVHVVRARHGVIERNHVVVVVVVQVHASTGMVRTRWHARVWIVHHVERIVLLMGHSTVLVMNAVHVVVHVVWHVRCAVMVTVQVVVVVNKLVVIVASIAKGCKIGIKRAHFMETRLE